MSQDKPDQQENSQRPDPEVWLDQFGDYLFRFACLRVNNNAVAEDLVQETFLSALKSYSSFSGSASLRSWLTAILKNKIIDYFRKQRVRAEDDGASDLIDEKHWLFQAEGKWVGVWKVDMGPSGWGAGPSEEFEKQEFWQALQACLGKLPDVLAQTFVLREIEELSSEAICKELGITSSNLWVSLHRARLRLRQCLENTWFSSSSDEAEAKEESKKSK